MLALSVTVAFASSERCVLALVLFSTFSRIAFPASPFSELSPFSIATLVVSAISFTSSAVTWSAGIVLSSLTLTSVLFSASSFFSVDLTLTAISLLSATGFATEPSLLITPVTLTLYSPGVTSIVSVFLPESTAW
ncbi:Uncharacterised protein [Chlamydia trachomatis]|nr:Uncharacterised protein [Chlamydia trachomatis]